MKIRALLKKFSSRKVQLLVALVLVLGLSLGAFLLLAKDSKNVTGLVKTPQAEAVTEETASAADVQEVAGAQTTTAIAAAGTPKTTSKSGGTIAPTNPGTPSTPSAPTAPKNTPTKPTGDWPLYPNPPAGFTCNPSQDWLTLTPGQETGWMTFNTTDDSNVFWEPLYKNTIWKNGTNDSPSASYWMVLDHNPGDHIASSVKFKIRVAATAPLTGTPGTGSHEEVMMFIIDASREVYLGCEFNFTIVAP